MLPTSASLATRYGTIAYREAGSGPPLILLHGLAGSSKSWEAQFGALANIRRVIAWDCPGYGGSDEQPGDAPTLADYADALLAFADGLGLERFDLLGHSMGGVIAGRFAALQPDRVRRLILSGTRTGFTRRDPASFLSRIEELRSLTPEEFGARRADGMVAASAPRETWRRVAAVAAAVRPAGFAAAARMLTRADNADLLHRIRAPALVLAGEADRIALPAGAEALAQAVAARLIMIAGAAHAPYLEQAAAYNDALRTFLSEPPARG